MTLLLVAKLLSTLFYALKKILEQLNPHLKKTSWEKTVNQLSICLS